MLQALLAGLFTWGVTALGSGLVFVLRSQSKKLLGEFPFVRITIHSIKLQMSVWVSQQE